MGEREEGGDLKVVSASFLATGVEKGAEEGEVLGLFGAEGYSVNYSSCDRG